MRVISWTGSFMGVVVCKRWICSVVMKDTLLMGRKRVRGRRSMKKSISKQANG